MAALRDFSCFLKKTVATHSKFARMCHHVWLMKMSALCLTPREQRNVRAVPLTGCTGAWPCALGGVAGGRELVVGKADAGWLCDGERSDITRRRGPVV